MIQELTDPFFLLAFVVTPGIVILVGYIGVLLHERSLDRNRHAPGE